MSKQSSNNPTMDNLAAIGGFIFSMYLLLGIIVIPFNQKMYLKQVIEDTFLVKKTNSLMSIIAPKTSKQRSLNYQVKKKESMEIRKQYTPRDSVPLNSGQRRENYDDD